MSIPCKITPLGWQKDSGALPAGYTPVEYIQSSGSQYIDSLLTVNGYIKAKCKIEVLTTRNGFVYGLLFQDHVQVDLLLNSATWGGKTAITNNDKVALFSASVGGVYEISATAETVRVNGEALSFEDKTTEYEPLDDRYDLYLFVRRYMEPGMDVVQNYATVRLYYLEIINDLGETAKMYPCVQESTGTPGLYDTARKIFLTNSGSGQFTYPQP